jgi:hypothetical protein
MNMIHIKTLIIFLIISSSSLKGQNIEKATKEENKIVYSDSVKMFMGDSIYVEFESAGNHLKGFKAVNKISDSTRTISLRLSFEKFGNKNASILKVSNPFDKQLSYRVRLRVAGSEIYAESGTLPVLPKIYGKEVWSYKIESIILYDFLVK